MQIQYDYGSSLQNVEIFISLMNFITGQIPVDIQTT